MRVKGEGPWKAPAPPGWSGYFMLAAKKVSTVMGRAQDIDVRWRLQTLMALGDRHVL